jgi:hypothetical protein
MEDHVEAKGTHSVQIPLFTVTVYGARFKLMVIKCAEETNNCGKFPVTVCDDERRREDIY